MVTSDQARAIVERLKELHHQGVTTSALLSKYFTEPRPTKRTLLRWLNGPGNQFFSDASLQSFAAGRKLLLKNDRCRQCAVYDGIAAMLGNNTDTTNLHKYIGKYHRYRKRWKDGQIKLGAIEICKCDQCDGIVVIMRTGAAEVGTQGFRRGGLWLNGELLISLLIDTGYMAFLQVRAVKNPKTQYLSGTLAMYEWEPSPMPMASRIALVHEDLAAAKGERRLAAQLKVILKNESPFDGVVSGWQSEIVR